MNSRYFLTTCLVVSLILSATDQASAQQSSRSSNRSSAPGARTTQVEDAARTRWQPIRPAAANHSAETPVRQAAHQAPARSAIRRTQGTAADLPAPKPLPQADLGPPMSEVPLVDLGSDGYEVPMHGERSVMQGGPRQSQPMHEQPMDGEVVYDSEPYMGEVYDEGYQGGQMGGYGCDSMGCSCGGQGCDGGCDSMGCGSCGGCNSCANGGGWRPCMTLCFPQDGWASFEYLNWKQRGMLLPPLVTTSTGTDRATAGVLGPNTTTLFGGNRVLDNSFNGGRLQFGIWLDKCHQWGIGAEYFELGERSVSFSQNSTGNPILGRPFFNVLTGREDAELVAFPNVLTGTVSAQATSQLVGSGVHLRHLTNCFDGCGNDWACGGCAAVHSRTYAMLGYRYLQLDESVQVNEDLQSTDTTNPGTFLISDRFETRNQFNGIDLGMLYNRRRGVWSLDLLAKLAIGNTHQVVDITGTTRVDGGTAQTGGLLAQTSNIGRHERDQFTILPELGGTVGYYLTPNFRLQAGYTLIFWSNVVRPGDQIDTDVNPNFLPPPAVPFTGSNRPAFRFVDSDYWVQGVNLGAQITW